MTPCTIRPATPVDADALSAFGERTFREAFGPANLAANMDAYVRQTYGPAIQLAELRDDRIHTLVAVDPEGGLAAYAQLRMRGPAPATVPGTSCELWRFYVDRAWHGQGLASELMHAVMDHARAMGRDTLWLAVWEHNPRAIAFYTREGFRTVGTQPFQLGDDLQTDNLMLTTLHPVEG